jgi:hypothetical protein
MSVESLAIVLHHSQASGTDKIVLIGIANHDGDGGAWPAVSTLARYANVDVRTVQRSLQRLIDLGEVSREVQGGGTRNMNDYSRPNRYELLVSCPQGCDRSTAHRVTQASPPDAGVTPPGDVSVTPPPTQASPKPSLNHPSNSDESSFVSTSPADEGKCFACGQVRSLRGRYCVPCRSSGRDNPMLNCVEHKNGCTVVGKRRYPGQDYIICPEHKASR